jgi:hypothetical protein
VTACGQKGPPLPPIIRTPVAPVITADRRGSEIQIALTAPAANVDGSRPANITRIDIYAINGAAPAMTDLDIMKHGTKVASLAVKAPKDPNAAVEKDESAEDAEPAVGEGLDQGASSSVVETITDSVLKNKEDVEGPLLGPPAGTQLRTYVGVGVDRHGNPGQFSKRVSVPLQLPPAPPPPIGITYDEKKITITWKPTAAGADGNVLESHAFGPLQPEVAYNLYDAATHQRLNDKPIKENGYEDTRMDWGTERCYVVRSVEVIARLPVESEATGPKCEKLVDTFPPAKPKGLNAVSAEGAINLIWDANTEPDLAGYYVWRATADQPLQQITTTPVTDSAFFDNVRSGLRFTYAVQAVDKAGNTSPLSDPVSEISR